MNALTTTETRALQAPQQQNTNALALNSDSLNSMMRVAELMASGRSTVPAHLQKSPADCMAVVMQALQWGLNPFAVAQKTHIVNGHLGYEGQLVNAVIQTSGSIDGRFHYEYRGSTGSVECRVGAVIRGESEITWGEWLSEAKVTTKNSPLWKTNPKQQLGYLQVKNWARLYCPGAILGVYSPDEFDSPQLREMGAAQEVAQPDPHAIAERVATSSSDKLRADAYHAAGLGVAEYQRFWKATGAENRKALQPEHERLKAIAVAADKARTVTEQAVDADAGEIKSDVPPAPEAPAVEPANSFEDVMTLLCQAKTEDELLTAAARIEGIFEAAEVRLLNAKFDERLEQIRGAK